MDVGKAKRSAELTKGIGWLDNHFALDDDDEVLDRYFYYFMVQSVGRYCGYRTFNGIDWFREVSAAMLADQQSDGSWSGPKGPLLSTSFALLYLARASDPLGICKVRWDGGSWNNRPHDLWNFVEHASDLFEVSTTWQIVKLNQPVHELIESPILYLSTDKAFEFGKEETARLRQYVAAGGLLVTNADAGKAPAHMSIRKLADELFADRGLELQPMGSDHPCRHIHARNVTTPMQLVDNGIRPLMIHFSRDVGVDLQRFNTTSPSFSILSNIYLYITGMKPHRARLGNDFVAAKSAEPKHTLAAARIQYDGPFDPEPGALRQLQAILANDHDVDLQLSTVTTEQLSGQKIAFLTTAGELDLPDEQARLIREWIEAGGTLWVDGAGGGQGAIDGVHSLIDKIAGDLPRRRLGRSDPIISGRGLQGAYDCTRVNYRFYALRRMGRVVKPQLEVVEWNSRPAIVFSTVDLTCGLAGLNHWQIFGYTPQSARKLVVNGCLAVVGEGLGSSD